MSINLPDALKSKNFISPELHFNTQETESEESSSAVSSLNESILNYILERNSYKPSSFIQNKLNNSNKIIQHSNSSNAYETTNKFVEAPLSKILNFTNNKEEVLMKDINNIDGNQLGENTKIKIITLPIGSFEKDTEIKQYLPIPLNHAEQSDDFNGNVHQIREMDCDIPKTPVFNKLIDGYNIKTMDDTISAAAIANNIIGMNINNAKLKYFTIFPLTVQDNKDPFSFSKDREVQHQQQNKDIQQVEEGKKNDVGIGMDNEFLRICHNNTSPKPITASISITPTEANLSTTYGSIQNKINCVSNKYMESWNNTQKLNEISSASFIIPGQSLINIQTMQDNKNDPKSSIEVWNRQNLDFNHEFNSNNDNSKKVQDNSPKDYSSNRKDLIHSRELNKGSQAKNFQKDSKILISNQPTQQLQQHQPSEMFINNSTLQFDKVSYNSISDPLSNTCMYDVNNQNNKLINPYEIRDHLIINDQSNNIVLNKSLTENNQNIVKSTSQLHSKLAIQSNETYEASKLAYESRTQLFRDPVSNSQFQQSLSFNSIKSGYEIKPISGISSSIAKKENNFNSEYANTNIHKPDYDNALIYKLNPSENENIYKNITENHQKFSDNDNNKKIQNQINKNLCNNDNSDLLSSIQSKVDISDNHNNAYNSIQGNLCATILNEDDDQSKHYNKTNNNNTETIKTSSCIFNATNNVSTPVIDARVVEPKNNELGSVVNHKPKELLKDEFSIPVKNANNNPRQIIQDNIVIAIEKEPLKLNPFGIIFQSLAKPSARNSESKTPSKEVIVSGEEKKNRILVDGISMKSSASIETNHDSSTTCRSSRNIAQPNISNQARLLKKNEIMDENKVLDISGNENYSLQDKTTTFITDQLNNVSGSDAKMPEEILQSQGIVQEKTNIVNTNTGKREENIQLQKNEVKITCQIQTPCDDTCKIEDISISKSTGIGDNTKQEKENKRPKFNINLAKLHNIPPMKQGNYPNNLKPEEQLREGDLHRIKANIAEVSNIDEEDFSITISRNCSSKGSNSTPCTRRNEGEDIGIGKIDNLILSNDVRLSKLNEVEAAKKFEKRKNDILNDIKKTSKNRIKNLNNKLPKGVSTVNTTIIKEDQALYKSPSSARNSFQDDPPPMQKSEMPKDTIDNYCELNINNNDSISKSNANHHHSKSEITSNINSISPNIEKNKEQSPIKTSMDNSMDQNIGDSKLDTSPKANQGKSGSISSKYEDKTIIDSNSYISTEILDDESYNVEKYAETIKNKKQKIFKQIEKIDKQLAEQGHKQLAEQEHIQIKEDQLEQSIDFLTLPSPSGLRNTTKNSNVSNKVNEIIEKTEENNEKAIDSLMISTASGPKHGPKSDATNVKQIEKIKLNNNSEKKDLYNVKKSAVESSLPFAKNQPTNNASSNTGPSIQDIIKNTITNKTEIHQPNGFTANTGAATQDNKIMIKNPAEVKSSEPANQNQGLEPIAKNSKLTKKFDNDEFNKILFGPKNSTKSNEKIQVSKMQAKTPNIYLNENPAHTKTQKDISDSKPQFIDSLQGITFSDKALNAIKSPTKDKPLLVTNPKNEDILKQETWAAGKATKILDGKESVAKADKRNGEASDAYLQTKQEYAKSNDNLRNSTLLNKNRENMVEIQKNIISQTKDILRKQSMENKSTINATDKQAERIMTPKPQRKQEKFEEILSNNAYKEKKRHSSPKKNLPLELKTSKSQDRIQLPINTKISENTKTESSASVMATMSDKSDWIWEKKITSEYDKIQEEAKKDSKAGFSSTDVFSRSQEWKQKKSKNIEQKEKENQEKEMKNCTFKPGMGSNSPTKTLKAKEFYERNFKWNDQIKNDAQIKKETQINVQSTKASISKAKIPQNITLMNMGSKSLIIKDTNTLQQNLKESFNFQSNLKDSQTLYQKPYFHKSKRSLDIGSLDNNIYSSAIGYNNSVNDQGYEIFHNLSSVAISNKHLEKKKSSISGIADSFTNIKKDSLFLELEKEEYSQKIVKKNTTEDITNLINKYQINSPKSTKLSKSITKNHISNETFTAAVNNTENLIKNKLKMPKTTPITPTGKKKIPEPSTDIFSLGIKPKGFNYETNKMDIQALIMTSEKVSKKFQKHFGIQS